MKNIFLIFTSLVVLFSSCKRTVKEGVLGPQIISASPNFSVLDTLEANYFDGLKKVKKDTVSFQFVEKIEIDTVIDEEPKKVLVSINYYKRNTFFKVKFNEKVSWVLRIKNFDSTVVKTISGNSSYLDSTNSNWDGSGDGTIFAKGDWIVAELRFVNGSSLILRDTSYIALGKIYDKSEATLLWDFEEGKIDAFTYNDKKDPGSTTPFTESSLVPPQGRKSLRMVSADNNGDYFCGGMNIQHLDVETMKNYQPRDIYLNMFVYGYPSNNPFEIITKATKLNIGFSEKDNPLNTKKDFDPKTEDTFEKQISVDWVGWKLISVRYGDLVRSGSKTEGGSGNGIFEPGKAFSANCNLIASPNGSIVGANIDYVIITYGKPFDTSNL